MIPTKCLLSALTTDKFSRQRCLGDRNSFGVPERDFVPEDSHTNKTRRGDAEQEKDSAVLAAERSHNSRLVLRSRPPRAGLLVPQDEITKGPECFALLSSSHSPLSFIFPSLRKDKGYGSVLLPLSKPPGVEKMVHPRGNAQKKLQDDNGRHQLSGAGR